MIVNNISSTSTYNQNNISFSSKKEVIREVIKVVKSPHIVSQAASQLIAPFLFNCDFSRQSAIKIKILGDIVEAICNLVSKTRISIRQQPTSIIAITVSGVRKAGQLCKKHLSKNT